MSQPQQLLNPREELNALLQNIFPSQQEETLVLRARRIMCNMVSDVSDEDMKAYITEFQYLINSWLDCFEQTVFDGSTLKQLLGQG